MNRRRFLSTIPAAGLAVAAEAETRTHGGKGPLRLHPENRRYVTDDGERAIFLTGSHTWANFQERGVEGRTPDFDFDRYLDYLQQFGHNFIRLWVWEQAQWMQFVGSDTPIRYTPLAYVRSGPGSALDGKPKFDLSRFNDEFFERLRARVEKAGERGFYVSVMLFQGFSVEQKGGSGRVDPEKGDPWRGHPFHKSNNINGIDGDVDGDGRGVDVHNLADPKVVKLQERYVRKTIDALNDLDCVLWEISNESHRSSVLWQYHMIRFIHRYEATKPKQHLVGMTSSPIEDPELFAGPADWISPRGRQWLDDPPVSDGGKLVIVDTDHAQPWRSHPQWVWKNLTRGNHFILMDHYMDFRIQSPAQPVAKHDPTRVAMGEARQWAEKVNLAAMAPRPDLASSGFCLTDLGKEYLIYFPEGGMGWADVSDASGELRSTWYDPEQRRTVDGEPLEGGGRRDIDCPVAHHALLHLKAGH